MHKILIVDDDNEVLKTLRDMVEALGYTADTAVNGIEGLKKFREGEYSLIITDIYMPGMDGIDLLQEIKNYNKDAKIAVITAYPSKETMQETILNNAVVYMKKPVDINELKAILEKNICNNCV